MCVIRNGGIIYYYNYDDFMLFIIRPIMDVLKNIL